MNVTLQQILDATWLTIYISLFSFILGGIIAFVLGFTLYFTRKGGIYENVKVYVILDIIINFIRSLHVTPCIEKSYTSLGDCFGFVSAEIEQREFYVLVDEDWEYCGAVLVGSGAITFRIQANACMNAHSKDI